MTLKVKSTIKILFYIITAYLILVILEYARVGFMHDLSLQKVAQSPKSSVNKPTYLISYASGGEYIYRNRHAMANSAINKNIDFILNYRKKHLSKEFYTANQIILDEPTGGGMWLWKPYIILDTMAKAPEGAYIVYLDSAFIIKQPIDKFIELMGDDDILLIKDRERLNGSYVKGDSFALTNCLNNECRYAPHIWSAAIVVRNNAISRNLIQKWLDASTDIRILSSKEYGIAPNYEEYKWHHYDQSVLSLIYYQNQNKIKLIDFKQTIPYISWFHRRSCRSSPLKAFYTLYGNEPVINFNKNGKTLSSTSLLNFTPLVYLRKYFVDKLL